MDTTPDAEQDREICVCFHVSLRKLVKYYHLHAPRHGADFAQCYGAGTGCGWCVPHLEKLFEQLSAGEPPRLEMSHEEYVERRRNYHRTRKPLLPPPPDADGPLNIDLDQVLDEVPDDMKLE